MSFSISGGVDQSRFSINAASGVLSFIAAPDFENPGDANDDNNYQVQISVSDGNGASASQDVTISVTGVSEAPVFTSTGSGTASENSVSTSYTASASDGDGNVLTYSLTGGPDASSFSIDSSTGVLSFSSSPDFENPGDSDINNIYEVTVTVSDGTGLSANQAVSISVAGINEAPMITSGMTGSTSENSTVTAYTAAALDPDSNTLTFSLSDGADMAMFSIDSSNGELNFNSAPDYENAQDSDTDNIYEVVISVADEGGQVDSIQVGISVIDINEAPSITSGDSGTAEENSTETNYTAAGDDPEGDSLTFSLSGGDDMARFSIDSSNGVLSFNSAPDYENPQDINGDNFYWVTIEADDGNGETSTQSVGIEVTNVNEPPSITSGTTSTLVENSTSSAYTAIASDPDGDALTFSLTGGVDQSLFSIGSTTGVLSFNSVPDYETPVDSDNNNSYEVSIEVTDGDLASDSIDVSVSVTNLFRSLAVAYPTPEANLGGDETDTTVTVKLGSDNAEEAPGYIDVNGDPTIADLMDSSIYTAQIEVPLDNILSVTAGGGGTLVSSEQNLYNEAVFYSPNFIAIDASNNRALVTDLDRLAVIAVDLDSGERSVLSDANNGTGTDFTNQLRGIAIDGTNALVVMHDLGAPAIIAVDLANGNRSVLSQFGVAGSGDNFSNPQGIVIDGDRALVADTGLSAIMSVDLSTGNEGNRTILSDNSGSFGGDNFSSVYALALDSANDRVLVTDSGLDAVVEVDLSTGDRLILSDAITGTGSSFTTPQGIVLDGMGNALVMDIGRREILEVDLSTGNRTLFADDAISGPGIYGIRNLVVDATNSRLLGMNELTDSLTGVALDASVSETLSSGKVGSGASLIQPVALQLLPESNTLFVLDASNQPREIDLATATNNLMANGFTLPFWTPAGFDIDSANNRIYFADPGSNETGPIILSADYVTGAGSTLSGDGNGSGDSFSKVQDVAFDSANNRLLVVDETLAAVFTVDLTSGDRAILSDGSNGGGTTLTNPTRIILDSANDRALVADSASIFEVDLGTGDRALLSGGATGSGTALQQARGLSLDSDNDRILVADAGAKALFAVDLSTGDRTILSDSTTGSGPNFSEPYDVTLDSANRRAFVADRGIPAVFVVDLETGERAISAK